MNPTVWAWIIRIAIAILSALAGGVGAKTFWPG
jgi:hypothetical protein